MICKRKYLYILIFVLTSSFLVSACGEQIEKEKMQSITFHDEYLKDEVIKELEQEGIHYRLDNNAVWYSIKNNDEVRKIYDEQIMLRPVLYKFFDLEKEKHFESLLKEQNIHPKLVKKLDDVIYVYISIEDEEMANKIFYQGLAK